MFSNSHFSITHLWFFPQSVCVCNMCDILPKSNKTLPVDTRHIQLLEIVNIFTYCNINTKKKKKIKSTK